MSATISIVQEARSERVLEALRNLASPRAVVIRDGCRLQIAGREVVSGDVIVVAEGDRVAADATLFEAQDLLLDESLLTGESHAVRKLAEADPPAADTVVIEAGGDATPWLFAGSLVVRGSGRALVHATGARSEMGKIGHALETIETEQPRLQVQIRRLVRDFAIIGALAGGLTVLLYGLLRGSWLEALLGGIALGMSLLPEEFPLVMAVFMAMGAWRISRARVLTRRAAAIESLGATTVLCTDKAGTLTENRMSVAAIVSGLAVRSSVAAPMRIVCIAEVRGMPVRTTYLTRWNRCRSPPPRLLCSKTGAPRTCAGLRIRPESVRLPRAVEATDTASFARVRNVASLGICPKAAALQSEADRLASDGIRCWPARAEIAAVPRCRSRRAISHSSSSSCRIPIASFQVARDREFRLAVIRG